MFTARLSRIVCVVGIRGVVGVVFGMMMKINGFHMDYLLFVFRAQNSWLMVPIYLVLMWLK